MNLELWQQNNNEYLARALDWLRLRLLHLLQQAEPPISQPLAVAESAPAQRWKFWDKAAHGTTARALLPPAPDNTVVTAERLAEGAARWQEAEAVSPPPALKLLATQLGMSRFEQDILLLCAALELDPHLTSLLARTEPQRPYPTFALAMTLFDEPAWEALSPERPLRFWRLLEINQPGAQPLVTSALRADERIVNFLKGMNYLDDRLAPLLVPVHASAALEVLPPSQEHIAEAVTQQLQHSAAQPLPLVQLIGADEASKQLLATRIAAALGLQLYRLPAESIPTQWGEIETLARLLERETVLWPLALYHEATEAKGDKAEPHQHSSAFLHRFLHRFHGVFFYSTREAQQSLSRAALSVDVAKPTRAEQQQAWQQLCAEAAPEAAAQLAGQFDLDLTTMQQIARAAVHATSEEPLPQRLWDACLWATRPQLDTLAQRIEPRATWADIVLPETDLRLLRQIADQVRHRSIVYDEWGFAAARTRGLSINALFAGESGTGKTMAAEVLANELQLNLYRIDLASVVNKYIGETEKNLRRVFDAAEAGGVILFFDEADALFGKRSEVKDSHDRHANIEVSYLLQRMEAYRGLAILTTNIKSALDQAFLRRLRFVVQFPFPDFPQRVEIWRRAFPESTPLVDINYERLAQLNVAGGNIRNIALAAAFLAAEEQLSVSMEHIARAARSEYAKLEKSSGGVEFQGWV